MTVPQEQSNLPEQIAILFFMSAMFRWQISPTKANYLGMPPWLRPTPGQLTAPHPIWLDLIIWPKAREKMCRNLYYHDLNALVAKLSNESISVNWPHSLSNLLMHDGKSNIVLNPDFAVHIKNLDNWSLGPKFAEV
jgi:hypothetical protein